jgi:hypothetical protein
MTNTTNNQNQTTNKKENDIMKQATNFQLVGTKQIKSVATNKRESFPVQVRMDLNVGAKSQTVSFGYSGLGGRQTYLAVAGKAPVAMSRKDFIESLRSSGIHNVGAVSKALSHIRYFNRDEFIVAKCECCNKGYVTAANVDYIQRNHKKLAEKLGRDVNEFSRICYACQGHSGKKPAASKPAKIEAQAHKATCEHCGKQVKSQKVAEYSLRTFGKVLCYKPCQSQYTKLSKQNNETPKQQEKASVSPDNNTDSKSSKEEARMNKNDLLTPALVEEIMALDVDPFSEIAKLQQEIECLYFDDKVEENTDWLELHEDHAEKVGASEASSPSTNMADDYCLVCMEKLPPLSEWKTDTCPSCVVDLEGELTIDSTIIEEAIDYLVKGASEASPNVQAEESGTVVEGTSEDQEEAKEESVVEREDTKEEAPASQDKETVCKSPQSESISSDSRTSEINTKITSFLEEACISYQEEDVPPMPEGL